MDKKRVNVKIAGPVYTVKPPIVRTLIDVELSIGDIRNCICAKATVEEILDNGKVIRLNLYNYNKDNNPKKKKEKSVPPTVKAAKVEVTQPKPEPKKVEAVNVKIQEKQQPKEEVKVQAPEPKKEEPKIVEKPKEQPKVASVTEKAKEALNKINEEKK